MIPVGNKVEVIASATKDKGARVRSGSLGYISTTSKVHCLGNNKTMYGAMYVVPAKIVFTRFGHERKDRNEMKFVALVYPTTETKMVKNKKAYLTKLVKQALDYSAEIRQIFKNEGINVNRVEPIVVHNVNTTSNIIASKNEFLAWLRSVALSGALHNLLFSPPMSAKTKTLNKLIDDSHANLSWLRATVSSRQSAMGYVDYLFGKDRSYLKAFVARVQEALQLEKLETIDNLRRSANSPFRGGGVVFGVCWQLSQLGLEKRINDYIPGSHMNRRVTKLAKDWSAVYTGINTKSL